MVSKIMGSLKMILSIVWMVLAILGLLFGLKGFDWVEIQVNQSAALVTDNLGVIADLLTEIIDVVDEVDGSLSTVETSMIDAGLSLKDARLLVDETSQIITEDVPLALEQVQASMPAVVEAAGTVDQTLFILSNFNFSVPNPFGADLEINLGVDYEPEVPLETALTDLSENLEGIPMGMRGMQDDLETTEINMVDMGDNLIDLAYNLDLMREQIADIKPELSRIVDNLVFIQATVSGNQERLPALIRNSRVAFTGLMVLLILTPLPALYTGYKMVVGASGNNQDEREEA